MIQVIVFSKDRPLQLHGYLTSLFQQWTGDVRVSALVKSEPPYAAAYAALFAEFGERVRFLIETNFGVNLCDLLVPEADLVCFGCDDAVFVAPVDTGAVTAALASPDVLGVSLRLGRTIKRGMFGNPMPQPDFLPAVAAEGEYVSDDSPSLLWDVRTAPQLTDWDYPWDMVGTVYPRDFVDSMLSEVVLLTGGDCSPNTLEAWGASNWRDYTTRYLMRAYPAPRLVLPAVNVVQSDFPNGIVGEATLSTEYLLDLWNKGVRMDVAEFSRQRTKWDSWRIGNLWLKQPEKVAA